MDWARGLVVRLQNVLRGGPRHALVILGAAFFLYKIWANNREIERLQRQLEAAHVTATLVNDLQQENIRVKEKCNDQTKRLSKMASERMREGNTAVEDLNDPRRPTALVSKWTSLFGCGEYWTAYENMKKNSEEAEILSVLHRVCKLTYETTKEYVQALMQELTARLAAQDFSNDGPSSDGSKTDIERFFPYEDERKNFLDSLRSLCSRRQRDDAISEVKARKMVEELLKSKSPPASLIKAVDGVLQQEEKLDLSLVKSFTDQLVEILYYMRSQEIPLRVDFPASEGETFDPSHYDVEGSTAAAEPRSLVIKSVLRPAVLRNEPGPVLSKGEVQVMLRSQWINQRNSRMGKSCVQCEAEARSTGDTFSTKAIEPEEVPYSNANEVRAPGTTNVTQERKEPPPDREHSAENGDESCHRQDQVSGNYEPSRNHECDEIPFNPESEALSADAEEEGTSQMTGTSLEPTTGQPSEEDVPAGASDVVAGLDYASGTAFAEQHMKQNSSESMEPSTPQPDSQSEVRDLDGNTESDSVSKTGDKQATAAGEGSGGEGLFSGATPSHSETAGDSSGSPSVVGMDSSVRSNAD